MALKANKNWDKLSNARKKFKNKQPEINSHKQTAGRKPRQKKQIKTKQSARMFAQHGAQSHMVVFHHRQKQFTQH